ncbi:MAG TPA: TrkH family potassium uptake protein [Alcanivoracaceae bacterium]|nr:TrkH family potassium uptake protein [Alcanivoracaceae bacterium]
MHYALITKTLGVLLMIFSFTMAPPALLAWYYEDGGELPFASAFAVIFLLGLALWLPVWNRRGELRTRDGFLIVTLFWAVLGSIGSLPFILNPDLHISVTDAVFESISGITTTGGTILTGLDTLPPSLLFYRQQLQWLGGMGIIVLAIAILPLLGVGGMQLYRAEMPGPMKESKLTPRIAETAKTLWFIYVLFTVLCALFYRWAGMTWFDAVGHSFSTVATGGFSTHDDSMAYFDSTLINMIGATFIFLGSVSFALHFAVFRGRSIGEYVRDPEFRSFVTLLMGYVLVLTIGLSAYNVYQGNPSATLSHSIFQALSFSSSTGFVSTDTSLWPSFLPYFLVLTSFIGGCAGSTSGGIKVIRVALFFRQSFRELKQLIYPSAVFSVQFGSRAVSSTVMQAVWGFIGIYIMLAVLFTMLFMATGLDFGTAFASTAASLNNLGQGIDGVADGYSHLSNTAKWMMCLGMLLGRLEIFTLLVLFTPLFWRQ